MNETKVYCGIGAAHNMMVKVNSHTEAADHVGIEYLLAWKANRNDMCADPFTVGKMLVMKCISASLSLMAKSFLLYSFIKLLSKFNPVFLQGG